MPQAYPCQNGLARGSPTPGLTAGSPVRRTSLSHRHSSDDDGVSTDTSISDKPLCRRRGSRGSQSNWSGSDSNETHICRGRQKKKDGFSSKIQIPKFGARRVILMMWPTPLGSGPAVSPTIMITMRILTSCPWWCHP